MSLDHIDESLKCVCQEFHPNPSDRQCYIDLRLEGPNVTGEWGKGYRACQQVADLALAAADREVGRVKEVLAGERAQFAAERGVHSNTRIDELYEWQRIARAVNPSVGEYCDNQMASRGTK